MKTVRNMQILAAAIAAAGCGAAMGETTELEQLQKMRQQPSASLYSQAMASRTPEGMGVEDAGKGVSAMSLTAVSPPHPKRYRKHDLVAIIVRQDSEASSNSTASLTRKQDFDYALQQFLEFARFAGTVGLGNVTNPSKLPEVKFKFDNERDADATNDRTDHMALRITAEILDVKPNGTLVLEAVAHIRNDREDQTMRLSGVARAEDIAADNTLLSTQLANLSLSKDTKGEVKDGVQRSLLNNIIDHTGP